MSGSLSDMLALVFMAQWILDRARAGDIDVVYAMFATIAVAALLGAGSSSDWLSRMVADALKVLSLIIAGTYWYTYSGAFLPTLALLMFVAYFAGRLWPRLVAVLFIGIMVVSAALLGSTNHFTLQRWGILMYPLLELGLMVLILWFVVRAIFGGR